MSYNVVLAGIGLDDIAGFQFSHFYGPRKMPYHLNDTELQWCQSIYWDTFLMHLHLWHPTNLYWKKDFKNFNRSKDWYKIDAKPRVSFNSSLTNQLTDLTINWSDLLLCWYKFIPDFWFRQHTDHMRAYNLSPAFGEGQELKVNGTSKRMTSL